MNSTDVKLNTYIESSRKICRGQMLLMILIVGTFMKKKSKKTDQKEFRNEIVIKRKGDKLYVKWKGYNNSFNSWIDK